MYLGNGTDDERKKGRGNESIEKTTLVHLSTASALLSVCRLCSSLQATHLLGSFEWSIPTCRRVDEAPPMRKQHRISNRENVPCLVAVRGDLAQHWVTRRLYAWILGIPEKALI